MQSQITSPIGIGVTGYSATIALVLYVNGHAIDLAQVGRDRIKPRNPELKLQPGRAELAVSVDGARHIWQVEILSKAMTGGFVAIEQLGPPVAG